MITLMTGVLIPLSGFVISNWSEKIALSNRVIVAIEGSLYLLFLFIYMLKNVLPNRYFVLGSEPSELMVPPFFAKGVREDKITIFLYMSEIENYDLRIESNLVVNAKRWKRYRLSVIWFLMLPVLLALTYALLNLLRISTSR